MRITNIAHYSHSHTPFSHLPPLSFTPSLMVDLSIDATFYLP